MRIYHKKGMSNKYSFLILFSTLLFYIFLKKKSKVASFSTKFVTEALEGYYFDPLHGGCMRRIHPISDTEFLIEGVYGIDEPETGGLWFAEGKLLSHTSDADWDIHVDFRRGKPHKKYDTVMIAKFVRGDRCIVWEDGNEWKKMVSLI